MDSCRELFKTMEILPIYDQYIFSLLLYNHDIRSANNFHLPIANLTKYQNRSHYAGIKIFNHLLTHIKYVANEIQVLDWL